MQVQVQLPSFLARPPPVSSTRPSAPARNDAVVLAGRDSRTSGAVVGLVAPRVLALPRGVLLCFGYYDPGAGAGGTVS